MSLGFRGDIFLCARALLLCRGVRLRHGSLSAYKNGTLLGVMCTGLNGRFVWAADLIESERGKPSGAHVELQCCNVARISVARDAARPK
eukprot:COSAG06_NODE_30219_length_542_cov_2.340858_1_plen_88_part_10